MELPVKTLDEVVDAIPVPPSMMYRVSQMPIEEQRQLRREQLHWPDGFLEKLRGLPVEQQLQYYGICESVCTERTAYGSITAENMTKRDHLLKDYKGLCALVVEDGVLLGVCIEKTNSTYALPVFPYLDVCTYYASDEDGAGSNDRADYAHLYCLVP